MSNIFIKFIRYFIEFGLINTLRINFHYFSFKEAIRFPIIASKRLRIRSMNGNVKINNSLTGIIRIGFDNVGVFDSKFSRSIWEVNGNVIFNGRTTFGNGVKICVGGGGNLTFGNNFQLTAESTIICYKRVKFGDNCLLSWDILIMDTDFHEIFNEKREVINAPADINIGDHVWIGCRSLILKGANIPDNSIIAANSTVTHKKLEPKNSLFIGSPARKIKDNINWRI